MSADVATADLPPEFVAGWKTTMSFIGDFVNELSRRMTTDAIVLSAEDDVMAALQALSAAGAPTPQVLEFTAGFARGIIGEIEGYLTTEATLATDQ